MKSYGETHILDSVKPFYMDMESIKDRKRLVEAHKQPQSYISDLPFTLFNYLSVSLHIITWTLAKFLESKLHQFNEWLERI